MDECKPPARGGVPRRSARRAPGRAVQVDPIKPTLKSSGTKRLILECDEPLSNFAFNFNLRRYTLWMIAALVVTGFDEVGWCRLTLSNPS